MEMYGRNPGREGAGSGQPAEWSPVGADTGLEESMWRFGLRSSESYPERPGVSDCSYYMRTGFCGFGSRCRYNHPRDRTAVVAAVRSGGEYPERPGELACQFYLKTGTCKFGVSCKFDHPKHGGGSISNVPLNYFGYPIRPGEKECSYYLKTGQCKFGKTCKFHHPQPAGISMPASAPSFYPTVQSPPAPSAEQYGGVSTSWRVARPPLLPGTYVHGAYGPLLLPPGVVPIPSYGPPYSAPVSPVLSPGAQPTVGTATLYGVTQLSSSTPALTGPYSPLSSSAGPSSSSQREQMFPQRPGQPNCQYYLKTGDCKFGSSCRFHHPLEYVVPKTDCAFSPMGLPLRPGAQPCSFYEQNGYCKFGPMCKFDHPMQTVRYSPSASSLTDIPIAPYPVGSSLATLAPSSSSSELRPEFISGSKKDPHSIRMSSSGNGSSGSVGLIFSQTGSGPLSGVQLARQSSASLSSSRSARPSGDIRRSI
ncbi:zinc finger CCCH domain-containing protein 32 [Malania oleifera]|uniref:zinc finger CCCH domain-containing protein 32 n=1 Tax=Malania oleifera TaxID=397392 RepID=UPI0025AE4D3E|nr:zinc finger CCCH domain-containing protein 32 [Malania oleifera]